ncbi:MAG TPA: DUF3105 domain-containing protein [Chloroflexota bacterium]|nr:DUF3105 domain-containing protein [Chloroflexota bacterium]
MSQEAVTKREKRLAAREDRKRRAAAAQKSARIRQIVLLAVLAVALIGLVVAGVTSNFFGLASSLPGTPVGRTVPLEAADHVGEGTPVTYKSRPPASGPHYPTWSQTYGFMEPAPPAGIWLHNLEHGAVVILYNCPQACPELEQQLKDLYPTLPLGRNARGGRARALILPYADMDHKIAVVAWGWLLELDEFDRDQIVRFYESRIDRGPECQNLACP